MLLASSIVYINKGKGNMTTRYTGTVGAGFPAARLPSEIVVKLDGTRRPSEGDIVEIRVVLTDEQIGKRLRSMLDTNDKDSLRQLANDVEDHVGWPVLADLIRDVTGL